MVMNKNNPDRNILIQQKLPIQIQCFNQFLTQTTSQADVRAVYRFNNSKTKLLPSPNLCHSLMLCSVTRSQRMWECETLQRHTSISKSHLGCPEISTIVENELHMTHLNTDVACIQTIATKLVSILLPLCVDTPAVSRSMISHHVYRTISAVMWLNHKLKIVDHMEQFVKTLNQTGRFRFKKDIIVRKIQEKYISINCSRQPWANTSVSGLWTWYPLSGAGYSVGKPVGVLP